ncbi:PIN domain-containing protein [Tsukamurella strandjordii]|uniref:PIN domain-containing protein n=1 Tax=Tsukamurella strandjordii TaxID=147577 RepID=A0AA90SQM9_9ACTN|nr:PIN domain-containing protein [Tsukamurella strandjordii]MDP0398031.1 PIN domain-containing protein [Tsukamurella strandjordii]
MTGGPRFVELATEPRTFVFDINVWLNVADLLGTNAVQSDRERLDRAVAQRPIPDREQPQMDDYRVWRMAASGLFTPSLTAIVYISRSMIKTLYTKLTQPESGPTAETAGLGWTRDEARDFISDAVMSFARLPEHDGFQEPISAVRGGTHQPALDHEDGMVLACALQVGAHFLVTSDSDFNAVRGDRRWKNTLAIVTPGMLTALQRRYGGGAGPSRRYD